MGMNDELLLGLTVLNRLGVDESVVRKISHDSLVVDLLSVGELQR